MLSPVAGITLYSVVLFVHIAAVVVAFGVTFAYPLIVPLTHRAHPRSLPYLYALQGEIGKRLITPAATVTLLAGLYLALAGPYGFDQWWVGVGLLLIVVLLGMGGAFFTPNDRRLAEIAERDLAASPAGEVNLSDEYRARARRLAIGGAFANVLVLVAIFVMVMGSRGYL
jgi:hypothetical protein